MRSVSLAAVAKSGAGSDVIKFFQVICLAKPVTYFRKLFLDAEHKRGRDWFLGLLRFI
jgi:hypothetical protein